MNSHPDSRVARAVRGCCKSAYQRARTSRGLAAILRWRVVPLIWVLVGACAHAAGWVEDFAQDPTRRGWQTFGQVDLFRWNSVDQDLEVTWDSAKPNSYFYRALGQTLSKQDDFQVGFQLRLSEIQVGTTPGRPLTFELSVGLLNFQEATRTNFFRGTATQSPDLVELDYFPDSGFGATISPVMVSSSGQFVPSFSFPLELTLNDLFQVKMTYTSTNRTLATTMWRNGAPFGPIKNTVLGSSFADFRVDTFSINSYNDTGADGSLLAHGVVDDVTVVLPPVPVTSLTGTWVANRWQVRFTSQTNWIYTLERTADLKEWQAASERTPGTGGELPLEDTSNPPASAFSFYRVRAEKP
jgi:hypothetical protein